MHLPVTAIQLLPEAPRVQYSIQYSMPQPAATKAGQLHSSLKRISSFFLSVVIRSSQYEKARAWMTTCGTNRSSSLVKIEANKVAAGGSAIDTY